MRTAGGSAAAGFRGDETILVAEDESSVRDVARRCLEQWGYDVLGAASPDEAEALMREHDRDIEREIARGTFRKDLLYRLHVLPIYLPPLRDRREDIPLLVREFPRQHNVPGQPALAMDALLDYEWPGNVRELANCIEQACVLKSGETITALSEREFVHQHPDGCRKTLPQILLDQHWMGYSQIEDVLSRMF